MANILSYVICLLLGAQSVLCCDEKRVYVSQLCRPPLHQYNTSCSMQLPSNFTDGDCTFFFEKNTAGCLSKKIPAQKTKQSSEAVHLKVYQYNDGTFVMPSFNVTMTNIKWNALNLKFSVGLDSVCIDIYISENKYISPNWPIFYDCAWYNQTIEEKLVFLEYVAKGNDFEEFRKFSFITPATSKLDQCNTSIQSHETLTYLDLTFIPHLTLHIQKLPAHLQVYKYEVKQCFCTNCSKHNNLQDCVHIETVEAGSEGNDDLTLPIDIEEESGNFFFAVYAHSKLCEERIYYISRTQTLTYKTLKGLVAWLISGYLLLFLLVITGFLLGRKYVAKLLAAEFRTKRRPRILLLHQPLHRVHTHVVMSLAQFLEKNCNVDVLLDINSIPKTENKDPLFWYNSVISSADFVAVIASPPCSDEHDAIYKDLHTVGLNFIKELLRSKSYRAKMFTIMLPYCDETGIPVLARHLQRFLLMQDIDSMVSLIHGNKHCCIRQALLSKIHNDLKTHGIYLNNFIAEMKNIVAQSGDSGSVLKSSVQEELICLEETEGKLPSMRKSVFEALECEELLDESNTAKSNHMNYKEFNLSDLDLSGMQNSVPVVPRRPQIWAQNCAVYCDDLRL